MTDEKKHAYRYLNADHTLVMRDDAHVIAWDKTTDKPADEQVKSAEAVDESKLWHDAGSPKPSELTTIADGRGQPITPGVPELPGRHFHPPWPIAKVTTPIMPTSIVSQLTEIETTIASTPNENVGELKDQVQKLTHLVRLMYSIQTGEQIQ